MPTIDEKRVDIFEQRAALRRAIEVVQEGDVPDPASGMLYNLCLDGWELKRIADGEPKNG